MPRGFLVGVGGSSGMAAERSLAGRVLTDLRFDISCLMVVSAPSSSIDLSIDRKPSAAIESRTLLLSIGTSIDVPSRALPSIEILALDAADRGVMSTVTLIVLGGGGSGGGGGGGRGSGAVATSVGGLGSAFGGNSVAAEVTPVPSPKRSPQNTPTARPAETTIGTARGARRCISPIRLNYARSA